MAIKDGISLIIDYLFNVSDAYRTYQTEKKDILNTYRDRALSDELESAEAKAKKDIESAVRGIQSTADSLLMATHNGNSYDASSDAVFNAAQLLSVKGVSREAVKSVVSQFVGNQVALNLIHASADPEYYDMIEPWMFDSIGTLERIKNIAGALQYESIENYPSLVSQIREAVQSYGVHQGIEFGVLNDRIESLRMQNVINLMGLDPSIL